MTSKKHLEEFARLAKEAAEAARGGQGLGAAVSLWAAAVVESLRAIEAARREKATLDLSRGVKAARPDRDLN